MGDFKREKRSVAMNKVPKITYSKACKLLSALELHMGIYWPGIQHSGDAIDDFKEQLKTELKEHK